MNAVAPIGLKGEKRTRGYQKEMKEMRPTHFSYSLGATALILKTLVSFKS